MTVNASYYAGGSGYTPADMLQRDADWVSAGVLTSSDLVVAQTATPSMNITVTGAAQGTTGGNAWLPNGYRIYNDSLATLAISTADATNPRIDLVIACIDTTTNPYTPSLKVIKGTATATPTVPTITVGLIGLPLAQVYVGANVTNITNSNITDVRAIAGLIAQSGDEPIAEQLSEKANLTTTPQKTTAIITYYVNTSTGADTNDGLTSGTAFKTIQHAIDILPQVINHDIVINVAQGAYNETPTFSGFTGKGTITINGGTDITTALNFTVNGFIFKYCGLQITCNGFTSIATTGITAGFYILACASVRIKYSNDIVSATSRIGVYAYSSFLRCDNCNISNKSSAITADFAIIYSNTNTGSGNVVGLTSNDGATIGKGSTQPSGTTAESTANGGVIR